MILQRGSVKEESFTQRFVTSTKSSDFGKGMVIMLCDKCKKNEANILYTEIINGKKKEQHLCEECATNFTTFQMGIPDINNEFSISELLSSLLSNYYTEQLGNKDNKDLGNCSNCNMSYKDIMKIGRFGCAKCYYSFYDEIGKLLRGIQGSELHIGKRSESHESITDGIRSLTDTDKLEIKLQDAIKEERYEEAALLRDKIKELKKEKTKDA